MTTTFNTQASTEILQRIGAALMADPRYAGRDWRSVAVVAILEPGASQLSGYAFDAEGEPEAATPDSDSIDDLFADLQHATEVEGKPRWKSALFQLRREGRYSVDFEYDDATRWKVSPGRFDEVIEAIRPR